MKKRILISGIGVAGIVTALSLDKEKYDIDIIEQSSEYRNIGFSITLWKAGFNLLMDIFKKYGVSIAEGNDYFKVTGFELFGNLSLKKLKTLDADGYAWVFERAHLMEILESIFERVVTRDNIRFGTTISSIVHESGGIKVITSDGREMLYDAVIIAEGINSTTRTMLFGEVESITQLPYSLRYAWFTTPTNLVKNGGLFFTKGHIGVIHPPYTRNLLGYYSRTDLSLELQRAFEHQVRNAILQPTGIQSEIDLTTSRIFDLKEIHLPRYDKNNVIFIGDAAHGRPPTLGFGTTLAVEDAVVISRMINNVNEGSIPPLFSEFSKTRIKRIEEVYRFQNFIHKFITENTFLIRTLAWCLTLFYGRYIEYRVKRLADYKI